MLYLYCLYKSRRYSVIIERAVGVRSKFGVAKKEVAIPIDVSGQGKCILN